MHQPDSGSTGGDGYLSSLGGDEWDPEELLGAMDYESGDFGSELAPAIPFQWVTTPTETHTSNHIIITSPNFPHKKKKLNYDPNKARNERRVKLENLRGEVTALEMKLKHLQKLRGNQKKAKQNDQSGSIQNSGMSTVWKEVCIRQLDQRLRVERENIQLKESCEKEMQVVQGLQRVLFKNIFQRDLVYIGENTRTRRTEVPTGCMKHMGTLIFDELSTGVENSYRVAEIVVEVNSPVPTNEMTEKPLLRDAMNGMRVEVFDHHIAPFGMRETGEAWWKHWNNYRGHGSAEQAGNVVVENFGLEFTNVIANTCATFYVQQILRRYVEDHRTVIVWNSYVEPFNFENERVNGVYFLEQSHVIIKSDRQTSSTTKNAVATRMSTCEIITPHFVDPKLRDDPKMIALTDFVASSLSSNIMMRNERMEDLLLDQSLQECTRTCRYG